MSEVLGTKILGGFLRDTRDQTQRIDTASVVYKQ